MTHTLVVSDAAELRHVALFAPRNCTGNSGDIGDTVLQTSLLRTLVDRSVFPSLATVHWWGTKWVVDRLLSSDLISGFRKQERDG